MTKPNVAEVADPSPPLFPADARFSSADDFFTKATRRLVQDWGYVVERSTEKPNKVTGRCERVDQGCPFRLCAILPEGKSTWRIHASSCVWDHSHPARSSSGRFKPRPGSSADVAPTIATDQPAEPSVAAVLFADGTRFATSEEFFQRAVDAALQFGGCKCRKHSETTSLLVARCTVSNRTKCRYKVHAVRTASGGWTLDATNSIWTHNHSSSNMLQPLSESATGLQKERNDVPKAATSNTKLLKMPKPTSERACTGPHIGDRFRDFTEVFLSAASVSIATLGNTLTKVAKNDLKGGIYSYYDRQAAKRCCYELNVGPSSTGSGCVILPTSDPHHSHGPCPELRADPSWRPDMRDPALVRAVARLSTAPSAKRKKVPSPIVEITSVSPKSKRQRLSPALRTDSSTIPSPSGLLAASLIYPSPALSASPLPSPQVEIPRLSDDPAAGAPLEDRLALVEAFVAGVDPAKVASARHLVAAGVDSHEALVNLASLGPALRKTFLDELAQRNAIGLGVLGSAFPAS